MGRHLVVGGAGSLGLGVADACQATIGSCRMRIGGAVGGEVVGEVQLADSAEARSDLGTSAKTGSGEDAELFGPLVAGEFAFFGLGGGCGYSRLDHRWYW